MLSVGNLSAVCESVLVVPMGIKKFFVKICHDLCDLVTFHVFLGHLGTIVVCSPTKLFSKSNNL